jgi:hypothetical protein
MERCDWLMWWGSVVVIVCLKPSTTPFSIHFVSQAALLVISAARSVSRDADGHPDLMSAFHGRTGNLDQAADISWLFLINRNPWLYLCGQLR